MSNADIVRSTATVAAVEDTFLGIDDLMTRHGIGRTKTYDLIEEEGFPTSVVPGISPDAHSGLPVGTRKPDAHRSHRTGASHAA
jgi:hypothetical protein